MTGDRAWKLGDDLAVYDNLLDGLTFEDLILAVHCNCPKIDSTAVYSELKQMFEGRKQDMMFLVKNNMDAIIAEAKKGRE